MANEISFEITEDRTEEAIKTVDEIITEYLEEAGLHLAGEAGDELENDPRRVDTGLLRNSITFALDGGEPNMRSYKADIGDGKGTYSGSMPKGEKGQRAVYIGTNVEYAPYVHEGTRRMTANRFLRNAIEKNKEQLKSKLEEALRNARLS